MNHVIKKAARSYIQNLLMFVFTIVGFVVGYCALLLSLGQQGSAYSEKAEGWPTI
jgi:hypothetical protein